MKMTWEKLLSDTRLGDVELQNKISSNPFFQDYYNIISSSFFRRLQDKTQVYPLDDNDFVRKRLTHSIEVSAIGEAIAHELAQRIMEERPEEAPENFEENLALVLRCAGLLHDLGNPPFGHCGEKYIRDWFEAHEEEYRRDLPDSLWFDFLNYDGNAHNLRISVKTATSVGYDDRFGMNLTCAVLNSFVKYPEVDSVTAQARKPRSGKIGYYYSEKSFLERICRQTGTIDASGRYYKNPVMLLLEMADDIAYNTADVEDAMKKGLVTTADWKNFFDESEQEQQESILRKLDGDRKFEFVRDALHNVRRNMIKNVVDNFMAHYEELMSGTLPEDVSLLEADKYNPNVSHYDLKAIRDMFAKVYKACDTRDAERFHVVEQFDAILSSLAPIFTMDEEELSQEQKDVYAFFRDKIVAAEAEVPAMLSDEMSEEQLKYYIRLMALVDYVSGMTDSYFINYGR